MSDRGGDKKDASKFNLKYTVSEGSNVVLDANDFLPSNDLDINYLYTWKQIGGDPVSYDGHLSTLSFTAPYVKGDDVFTRLSFELTIKDNKGKPKGSPYTADVIVKLVQRAIIFQGGAALGAYEAGTYRAIVERLVKENRDRKLQGLGDEKRPLFDIVAGTSSGSMNGAIVVSSVTEEGKSLEDMETWEDSVKSVKKFWKYQISPTVADFLDTKPSIWRGSATGYLALVPLFVYRHA